jgi:hypothetical protein
MTVEIEQEPTTGIKDAAQLDRSGEIAKVGQQQPGSDDAVAASPSLISEPPNPAANRIYAYAAIAVGLGILLGVVFAAIAWQRGGRHELAQRGPVTASAGGLSSNSPTFSERAESLKRQPDTAADTATAQATAAPAAPAHRRRPKLQAQPATVAFGIEGDDELVSFDSTRGIVETSTRKFVVVGKPIAADNSAAWQDVPADVHYKCDLNAMCSLRRRGAGILYAQWKR